MICQFGTINGTFLRNTPAPAHAPAPAPANAPAPALALALAPAPAPALAPSPAPAPAPAPAMNPRAAHAPPTAHANGNCKLHTWARADSAWKPAKSSFSAVQCVEK